VRTASRGERMRVSHRISGFLVGDLTLRGFSVPVNGSVVRAIRCVLITALWIR
jgi:hypothetical protein